MNFIYKKYTVPISVKGIIFESNKVWLRKNERQEWELPGGKLDKGEQPAETVVREIKEELGMDVEVKDLVHAYLYKINSSSGESNGVLVISYLCSVFKKVGNFEYEGEAGPAEFKLFSLNEIEEIAIPKFYKDAIKSADFAKKINEKINRK